MSEPTDKIVNLADVRKASEEVVAKALEREPTITQDGIARIFAERFADRLRYDHGEQAWYEFVGTHWRRDGTKRAFEFVRQIAREQSEGRDTRELKEFRKTAFAAGVERFAQSDPALAVLPDQWDRDPFLLATPGGIVDLATGAMRPARADDYVTKLTAVAPAPTWDCPLWEMFLAEAAGRDGELVRFLRQWFGYCLTGDVREHALVFGYGPGGNGKSVLLSTVSGILGDYATTAPAETFATSLSDRHPTELARLRGARLVAASETEHGRAWAESRVKALTGGDKIAARHMRQDFFEFMPAFKLMIVGNHQPQLHHVDDALRRRFNIVPFVHRPATPDLQLEAKLKEEWPEILAWMIRGCLDWQRSGLQRPACVVNATADYFADQDVMAQWLDAACEVERGNQRLSATSTELYRSWCAYAKAAGIKAESTKAFGQQLQRRGFIPFRSNKARGFLGIAIRPTSDA
jgi:putative DNA primase/helicase